MQSTTGGRWCGSLPMVVYWSGDLPDSVSPPPMTLGLVLTAFGLGLRHGIDWDHIAAIADLSSTAESRRRGFFLSFLYAAGHGLVVIVLGLAAILFGAALPEGVDVWMGRLVGVTLIALGAWVLIELIRKGRDFRLRSRWILVLGGTFAGLRRVREANARRRLTIEHDHDHPHAHLEDRAPEHLDSAPEHLEDSGEVGSLRDNLAGAEHDGPQAHDHDHLAAQDPAELELDVAELDVAELDVAELETAVGRSSRPDRGGIVGFAARAVGRNRSHRHRPGTHGHSGSHRHSHSHETVLAGSASGTGNGTAAGIGLLHGIGFESPTQIAVFVASTSVVGVWAGVGLLVAWVIGLIVANSILAVLAAYGLLGAERNFVIYATVAVFVGLASLTMGVLLLVGLDVLPAIT